MKNTQTFLPLCAALSLVTGSVNAADWTAYRGPTHDGKSSESISSPWSSEGLKVVWKVPSEAGFSSFVAAKGQCFTEELRDVDGVQQEALVARNAEDGKEQWVKGLGTMKINDGGESGTPDNKGGDGPRSTPAVDGGRVYTFSQKLVVQCFDAKTGAEVWKRDLIKQNAGRNIGWQNAQSPVIDGNLVLVAGGGAGESVLGLDKKTGEVVWKAFDEKITHATCVPTTILGKHQVVFFLQSGLLSIDPTTGTELWRYPFDYSVSTASSPVIAGDIVYCSAGYGVGAGAAKISKEGDAWKATQIYRIKGKPLANHWSTPVVKDGYLYGMFQFKEYGTGPIKCVELATGKIMWEKSGFGPGQVILVGKNVLALADDGNLVLFEAIPESYHELAKSDVLDGKCWGTPILSNGHIFARSTKEAVCLDVSAKHASR
jgi:outer membrane protein assembly factor BamB